MFPLFCRQQVAKDPKTEANKTLDLVLRLALALILQAKPDDVVAMMGVVPCSAFIRVSQGSTGRCPFLAMGSPLSPSAYFANKLLSRHGLHLLPMHVIVELI